MDAAPTRIIPGTSFEGAAGGKFLLVEELQTAFTKGGFKVMGEIGLRYQGMGNPLLLEDLRRGIRSCAFGSCTPVIR